MRTIAMVLLLAGLIVAGCGGEFHAPPPSTAKQPQVSQTPATAAATNAAQTPARQSGLTTGMTGVGGAAGLAPADAWNGPEGVAAARPANAAGSGSAPSGPTYEKAQMGVGKRGRGYGGGIVTTPIATYFGMRERITFLSIENAMKTYKVMNDGPPKTQEIHAEDHQRKTASGCPTFRPGTSITTRLSREN